MTMEALELEVGDYTFTARAAGPSDGELVLLLHGFPETSFEWKAQLPMLAAAGYRAVAPDQRGYARGARPAEPSAYLIDFLVDDVIGFADALGAERFHLVGHDWGGAIAWYVAGRRGDRLHTLTVVSTPHPVPFARSIREGEQREKSEYMIMLRSDEAEETFLGNDAAMLQSLYAGSGLHDADAAAEYVRVLREPGALTGGLNYYRANTFEEPLGPITVPTMYVWSTDDIALGREAAEGTAACVEGPYRFEVIEGVSHWIPEEAPDALNALLLEHLASV
jgi:pimeloyl-ACP methyl ester carboxylesterase